jgi:hypothetical protein
VFATEVVSSNEHANDGDGDGDLVRVRRPRVPPSLRHYRLLYDDTPPAPTLSLNNTDDDDDDDDDHVVAADDDDYDIDTHTLADDVATGVRSSIE